MSALQIKIIQLQFLVLATATSTHCFSQENISNEMLELSISGHCISYPNTWEPDTSGSMGSVFFLHSPLLDEEDQFSENINLVLQNLPKKGMKSSAYLDLTLKGIKTYLTDYTIIENKKTKKNGKQCYVLEYAGSMNDFELHFLQYIWVQKDKVQILTFTAQGHSFEYYRLLATQIMESMKSKC